MPLQRSVPRTDRVSKYILICFIAYFVLAAGLAARWRGTTEATIVCSACLGVAFAISLCLRLPELRRQKVALFVTAMVFSLYACESLFAVIHSFQGKQESRVRSREDFDNRTMSEVLDDMRSDGMEAVPTVAPEMFVRSDGLPTEHSHIYPIGGMSHKCTLLGNESGEWAYYSSDRFGFNNPSDNVDSQVDIVMIGDSFAQGVAVQPGKDIGGQLRTADHRVANLGTSGNGPLIELATLKEYAEPLKPLVVLWFYYEENDLFNLRNERQSALLMRYLDPTFSQGLRSRQQEIDLALGEFIEAASTQNALVETDEEVESTVLAFAKLSHLRKLARDTYQRQTWRQDKGDLIPHFRQIMEEAKSRTESWGGRFYFVYLPCWNRYGGVAFADGHYHRDAVLACVKELGIPAIDIHREISKLDDPLSIFPGRRYGHYNARGYELVAKRVHDVITPTIARMKTALQVAR